MGAPTSIGEYEAEEEEREGGGGGRRQTAGARVFHESEILFPQYTLG